MPDVVLPVLNEAEALPWVLGRMPVGYRAIVVDNGSTDGSGRIATELGAVVVHEARPGFGSACFAGLRAATADVVCFVDADGSLDPHHLPTVADPVVDGAFDLVLGARRAERGAWPWHARIANRVLALEMRRRGARPVLRDIGPMRAARREALLDLDLRDRRFGWPLEMVVRAGRAGWRIHEVEVPYAARRGGRSKVTGTARGTVRTIRDMSRVLSEDRAGRAAHAGPPSGGSGPGDPAAADSPPGTPGPTTPAASAPHPAASARHPAASARHPDAAPAVPDPGLHAPDDPAPGGSRPLAPCPPPPRGSRRVATDVAGSDPSSSAEGGSGNQSLS